MNTTNVKRPVYRIPPSKFWAQYWYPWEVGILATLQLIMTLGTVGMEIGNAVVDIFRANIFSGFWSFPFMISAIIASYACVCATRTQTKAIIALILQVISMVVMLIVMGFLMAFIVSNYTLCLGFQCSQSASTYFSSSTYNSLKQAFISCELACSIIYILLSIIYIILFIRCYKQIPRIHPIVRASSVRSTVTGHRQSSTLSRISGHGQSSNLSRISGHRQSSNLSRLSRHETMSTISYNRSDITEKQRILSTSTTPQSLAQKVCPNCKNVSPYIPQGNIVECPHCKYQSPLVEHAQQS